MPCELNPFCSKHSVVYQAMQTHHYCTLLADSFVSWRQWPQASTTAH